MYHPWCDTEVLFTWRRALRSHARGVAGDTTVAEMSIKLDEACAVAMGRELSHPFSTRLGSALLLVEYAAPLIGRRADIGNGARIEGDPDLPFSLELRGGNWHATIGWFEWIADEPQIAICGAFLAATGTPPERILELTKDDS